MHFTKKMPIGVKPLTIAHFVSLQKSLSKIRIKEIALKQKKVSQKKIRSNGVQYKENGG